MKRPFMVIKRPLGTMITYGFVPGGLTVDLAIAARLGATVVEILPDWRSFPDPTILRTELADSGFLIHSAHGCWGEQSIKEARVDLGSLDPRIHSASIDEIKRCVEWLNEAGGTHLVIHPGGLSDPEDQEARHHALRNALLTLADDAIASRVMLCVENMPPGVYPGSRMNDLRSLVAEINQPLAIGLALDTGHAHISSDEVQETIASRGWLRTTHVHDNDGRRDTHWPPGSGSVDWLAWVKALDSIDYRGPIILECIRHLRRHPESLTTHLVALLKGLTVVSTESRS